MTMRLDAEVIARLGQSVRALELHGEPNAYGGRPIIARVLPDAAGTVLVEQWQDRGVIRQRAPAAAFAVVLGELAERDGWEQVG
jgi:hypothetical protein